MTTYFTPETYGAVGDGVADDTRAWQDALDALPAHGGMILAAGVYKVGQLNVTKSVRLEFTGGVSGASARLVARDPTGPVLNVVAQGFEAVGLVIASAVTRTSGAFVRLENAPYFSILNYDLRNPYIGFQLLGSSIGRLAHGQIRNATHSSVAPGSAGVVIGATQAGACTAVVIDDLVMDTDPPLDAQGQPLPVGVGDMPSYGIQILESDAVIISNCDIIRSGRDLALMPAAGKVVANTYIHDSYFDTAEYGVILEPAAGGNVSRTWLENVWTSSHLQNGVLLVGAGDIEGFHAHRLQAELNTQNGVLIGSRAVDTWIDYGSFAQNGSSGVAVAPNTRRFKIRGNRIGPHDHFTANDYGVYVDAGCSDYEIRDNDLTGNTTVGLRDVSLAATGYVTRNLGYATRSAGSTGIVAGATSVTVSHGLASAPPVTGLSITPVSDWAGVSRFWIDSASITATQFTIRVNAAPSSTMHFAWQASTEKD
ncbi:MAG: right-handed parallel beta-helix repeat-containing protein [Caulobacter sp.]|nr:right-handed parallel beta-helix repeat-containing protein [Caulobacter sp.]